MKNAGAFAMVSLVVSLAGAACRLSTPTQAATQVQPNTMAAPSAETPAATPTAIQASSPPPTAGQLRLEVVQSQAWTDPAGQVRVNLLLRNPYPFPVSLRFGATVNLLNESGEFMRTAEMYSLDGISGGTGFILPGETIAANGCFTCENTALPEAWGSVEAVSLSDIQDATGKWDYSTQVEASLVNVSFDGDSPIFDVSGTAKNNTNLLLDRISVRIFVYDQEGVLVGAAEASAWDVVPGATVNFDGYGIGEAPDGPFTYEVTVLGVKY